MYSNLCSSSLTETTGIAGVLAAVAVALVATVVGLTVDSVVLNRVTDTTPFVAAIVVVVEPFRCGRGVLEAIAVVLTAAVDVPVTSAPVDACVGSVVGAAVGAAVVSRVVVVAGGAVGLFLGSRLSTTPTGPFRSISVSGQVISSAWIE